MNTSPEIQEFSPQLLVVKLGTQVAIDPDTDSLAEDRLQAVVDDIVALKRAGNSVVLVSSGAVGLGKATLGLSGKLTLQQKQACAAVGQHRLMEFYYRAFKSSGIQVGQVLLTARDFSAKSSYDALSQAFLTLLENDVVPIVNENDVTSTAGIRPVETANSFDDNDRLSAVLAAKLKAGTLVILTNVPGVYTANPETNPEAELIKEVSRTELLEGVDAEGTSLMGRGGMKSKMQAAKLAALSGVNVLIGSGFMVEPIKSALNRKTGTVFLAGDRISRRDAWIAFGSGFKGVVQIDRAAAQKLSSSGVSLLPVGVTSVQGKFECGDVISIQDPTGFEIARGVASQSALTLSKTKGLKSAATKLLLGSQEKEEVVHRNSMVRFTQIASEEEVFE